MSDIKLKAASGGGSISLKGPSSAGSDTDFLDTSGNLKVTGNTGVGVTASQKLHVDKGAPGGSNAVIARFQAESSRRLDVVWHDSGSYMGFDTPSDHGYIFKTNGTERLRIKNDGTIQTSGAADIKIADGNLIMGSAGKGIDFSATGDGAGTDSSELFDDYEEGTFTPVLGGTTNHSSYNLTGFGDYVKIGKMVNCHISFTNKNLDNSAAGTVRINGFPYTSSGVEYTVTTNHYMYNVAFNTSRQQSWYMHTGSTEMDGIESLDEAAWISWPVTDFNNSGMYLRIQMNYLVA